jgi:hypothetical protein
MGFMWAQPDRDQLPIRSNSEVMTYTAEMARRLVGASKIMITHVRFTEKIQLRQISLGPSPGKWHVPEVEGAVPYQTNHQTGLLTCNGRDALVTPVHVESPRSREEEDQSVVPELPRNIQDRGMSTLEG